MDEDNPLHSIRIGDTVVRYMAGITMDLPVTNLRHDRIICADWEFCIDTGAEIDEDLGWGPPPCKGTGSFIMTKQQHEDTNG